MLKVKFFTFLLLSGYVVLGYGNSCSVNSNIDGTTQVKIINNLGKDLVLKNKDSISGSNYAYQGWNSIGSQTGIKSGNTAYFANCGVVDGNSGYDNSSNYIKLQDNNGNEASIFYYTVWNSLANKFAKPLNCTLGNSAIQGTCSSSPTGDGVNYCTCIIDNPASSSSGSGSQ